MEPPDKLILHVILLTAVYAAWRVSIGGQVNGDGAAFGPAAIGAIVTWIAIIFVSRAAGRKRTD